MDYDLIIIGAGWAGISAAREALERGLKTCLIEAAEAGGTCLNRGCIPTKSLLEDSSDLPAAQERAASLISGLRQSVLSTLKGIDILKGRAELLSAQAVSVAGKELTAGKLIIASGSVPRIAAGLAVDHQRIVTSDDMLAWSSAPKSLLVVGGGALGLEFAEMFSGRGTQVTVAEAQARILASFDEDVSRKLSVVLEKKGVQLRCGRSVSPEDMTSFEKIAVCIGRQPLLQGFGLEKLNIACAAQGIAVDSFMQTSLSGVYAAGDCTGLNMQAHAAALQGRIAAAACAGDRSQPFSSFVIPQTVFTHPAASGCGLTVAQAQAQGMRAASRTVSLVANPMARIRGDRDGLVKVIWDTGTDRILGAWIVSAMAAELIAVFTLALQHGLTRSQLRRTVMVHPSLSESLID